METGSKASRRLSFAATGRRWKFVYDDEYFPPPAFDPTRWYGPGRDGVKLRRFAGACRLGPPYW
jgi:hypothetical protein